VTESVAKVLQCISALASTLSNDKVQGKVDEPAKTLEYNWLRRESGSGSREGTEVENEFWILCYPEEPSI